MTPQDQSVPYGYCHCGCGRTTSIATRTKTSRGQIKGLPLKFIPSHTSQVAPRIDFTNAHPFKIDGVYCKLIPLTKGQFAIVLESRFAALNTFRWFANWNACTKTFYAGRNAPMVNWRAGMIFMHREILGLPKGDTREGDHINGVTLDNRDNNLRVATNSQNGINSKVRSDNASGRKGVSFHPATGKWAPQIMANGKVVRLKEQDTFEEACQVREEAERVYHGEFTRKR